MKKLINGILEFRSNGKRGYSEKFGEIENGQAPDALFIACSDSRVIPNTFASTAPGDLFVIRNVGNLIPKCEEGSSGNNSEAAAIEYSIQQLNISDIIVCGHSDCAAIHALIDLQTAGKSPNFNNWLRHGLDAKNRMNSDLSFDSNVSKESQFSQINVLLQMDHLTTYPVVQERLKQGKLQIHGWWFDIKMADVYSYEEEKNKFVLIDEDEAKIIVNRLDATNN